MRFSDWKALALGVVLGFAVSFQGCGNSPASAQCTSANCEGCCATTKDGLICLKGTSMDYCGATGASCAACGFGQVCAKLDANTDFGGRCSASTGGGSGGSGGSGGGTGGAGGCTAANCTGCCAGSACITNPTPSRCGKNGGVCQPCANGSTCVAGDCVACSGCVNLSTGSCEPGNTAAMCGRPPAIACVTCNTDAGQTCQNGLCQGGAQCNSTNCADGCCDGNTCRRRVLSDGGTEWSDTQCGSGVAGTACVNCAGRGRCDVQVRTCSGAGGGTGGAGGGVGFPDFCSEFRSALNLPACAASQCCDFREVLFVVAPVCINNGETCETSGNPCTPPISCL